MLYLKVKRWRRSRGSCPPARCLARKLQTRPGQESIGRTERQILIGESKRTERILAEIFDSSEEET